jgi:hypothetical protein
MIVLCYFKNDFVSLSLTSIFRVTKTKFEGIEAGVKFGLYHIFQLFSIVFSVPKIMSFYILLKDLDRLIDFFHPQRDNKFMQKT